MCSLVGRCIIMFTTILLISSLFLLSGFGLAAFAEQHEFTNTLPNYLEIEQNDIIFLKNLTNSTINLRHTGGLFSSGELYTNGTWTGNMPYATGIYEWTNVNVKEGFESTGTIVIKEKLFEQQSLFVEDNIIKGKVEPGKPIAVTVISPSYETTNKVITADNNGEFETKLNPEEKGEHQIFITQDSHTLRTTYTVEDEFKNLELRLSLLQVLRDIMEIVFGK